jgi:cyclic pyranopterin phosphate synthase
MNKEAFEAIRSQSAAKGDVLSTARIAGIMAAKKTADLVPLCHPLLLDDVRVDLTLEPALPGVSVQSVVTTTGRTGVEMEAIVAVTITLVTVYDMLKSLDRSMTISDISLVEKTGGQSDPYFAR